MTQDDAGSAPMLGSQPVAWAVYMKDCVRPSLQHAPPSKAFMEAYKDSEYLSVVPLYAKPQPTLTEDELDAIEHGLARLQLHSDIESEQSAKTLVSLLERLGREVEQ